MIKLRPHHLLCSAFYVNKGYSDGFCENFSNILLRLNKGENFILTEGADDLCKCCPHKKEDNSCATQQKTQRYDSAALDFFKLNYGEFYDYAKVMKSVKNTLAAALNNCVDCQWQSLCKEVLKKYE